MNNTLKPQRNYGIDLLRIFSMFLIALLHILGQGGVIAATNDNALKFNTACILEIGTYCCVNCFALISGYVGYKSKFRYTNIVMLWLRVLFYTVSITAIFAFAMPEAMVNSSETSGEFFLISEKWDNAVFPLISGQYWYFSSYFICYLLTPVLNKAVEALSQKQMKRTLAASSSVPCSGENICRIWKRKMNRITENIALKPIAILRLMLLTFCALSNSPEPTR